MDMTNINKLAVKIIVSGTKTVTLGAGVTVLATIAKDGLKGVKQINMDTLLK